ncbi:ribbon-helix-helix domain-containing protein [bacterium]|nr:ribbon-helix-helix domain-containing protein [bacterium]
MDKDRTNVLLDKDTMISLKNMARLEGKSVTLLVREAITEYLSKHLIKNEFGIIGIGESNIEDTRINIKNRSGDFKKE